VRRLRLLRVLTGLLVTAVLTALLCSSPAQAGGTLNGVRLLLKGPGSSYTDAGGVALAVAAGGTSSFGIRMSNAGATTTTYYVNLQSSSLPATAVLYSGSGLALTRMSDAGSPSPGFYPVTLASGATKQMTVKVTLPKTSPQGINQVSFGVLSEVGDFLNGALLTTNVKPPARGSSAYEVYARSGTQPFIGGEVDRQFAMAPPIATGSAASFSVKLQNDSALATRIGLKVSSGFCGSAFPVTVKDGTRDVTADALAGTYRTPVALGPGASRTLTVFAKNLGSASCATTGLVVQSLTPEGTEAHYEYLIVARKAA
jgi:hypothetical protein